MRAHTCTHSQLHTLEEVGDIEDVRSVSEVRGGDGQGIRTGDMEEIGYCTCCFHHIRGSVSRVTCCTLV